METHAIDVSITITTCSRGSLLQQALEHLLPQAEAAPFRCEFVLIDDCSTDNTSEVLRSFQRRARVPVTLIRGTGTGIAAARNLQVPRLCCTWLACCDDDQIADPDWLVQLRAVAFRSGADFVGGAMYLRLPPNISPQSFGPRARRLLGEAGLHQPAGQFPRGCYPATNNVLMRAEAVRQLGGFNPGLTEGGEDRDLFARAAAAGHMLWFTPTARMGHIIPPHRVTQHALRWTAMRIASGDTRMLHLQQGPGGTAVVSSSKRLVTRAGPVVRLAAVRTAVLAFRDLPQLLAARLLRRPVAALDVLCSIWYTLGVLRTLPVLLRPRMRTSQAFLQAMDFRQRDGERTA